MFIPFTKAHGAKNDFLLTMASAVSGETDLPATARAICERHTGVGADGWILVDERPGIRLFNSDGSEPELSGNGTRCAAAYLMAREMAGSELEIQTGAGPKQLRLISRNGNRFQFEMDMGRPRIVALRMALSLRDGARDVTLVDCGNPQCVVPVADFDWDWPAMGAEIESHPHFPKRTNVSFIRAVGAREGVHQVDTRFYERGAGITMSSGTGSTGAAACAMARGMVSSPVEILTPAGPFILEDRGNLYLTGPTELVAEGTFFYD